jgi:hypothetical protein
MTIEEHALTASHRRLSIEEVSVIFDTGRKGNAAAAAAEFHEHGKEPPQSVVDGPEKHGISNVEKSNLS